jgi:nucleoside-diphosphate-sugar epimerase
MACEAQILEIRLAVIKSKAGRVAVVGANSQIGLFLVPRLVSAGYAVFPIGREDKRGVIGQRSYVFDESSGCFNPTLDHVDALISLAPLPTIAMVLKMAQSLNARRIIAFGSTGRYSKIGSTSPLEQDFVVQQERAENLFSITSEEMGIGWTLFRPTMIYGADADQNVYFIKSMIRKFGFFPMPIGANGMRQPVHVNDLAVACMLALNCDITINRAYNLGGGEMLVFADLVKRIFNAEELSPVIIRIPKVMFLLLIAVAQKLPGFTFLRRQMIDRMYQDLTADNQPAKEDFGYEPQAFRLNKNT